MLNTASREPSEQRLSEFYQTSDYQAFDQEHRSGGTFGLNALIVDKDPYQASDPGFDEWIFSYCWDDVRQSSLDVGDGAHVQTRSGRGTVTFIPPNVAVDVSCSCPVRLSLLALPSARAEALLEGTGISPSNFGTYLGKAVQVPGAGEIMSSLWTLSARGGPSASLLIDGRILQLLGLLADSFDDAQPVKDDERLTRVIEYIESSLAEAMTVADLASIACLSPSQFARHFKAGTGETAWNYVQRRRCERAREALLYSQDSIAEIALACGFCNQGHLTSAFRKTYGLTPGSIRLKH